jgi:methionyl-tRNA formyltransferase
VLGLYFGRIFVEVKGRPTYIIDRVLPSSSAVGAPYSGARTTVGGIDAIRVLDVTVVPDLCFEIRDPGKIWSLNSGRPIVICGEGMLRIEDCRREDGFEFLSENCAHRSVLRKGGRRILKADGLEGGWTLWDLRYKIPRAIFRRVSSSAIVSTAKWLTIHVSHV